MPRLPRITGKEAIAALARAGFVKKGIRGSHHYMMHPENPSVVTIPVHARQIIPPKTLKSILDQAGLTVEEFIDLL